MRQSVCVLCAAVVVGSAAAQPQYTILDIGLVDPGDFAAQGFGSSAGGVAVGRSVGVSNQGFMWTMNGGLVGLPNLADRAFGVANGANDAGVVVGNGTVNLQGTASLPVMWENGVATRLALLDGRDVGRANGANDSGVAVGSNGGGSEEQGVYWDRGSVFAITQTTGNGSFLRSAVAINGSGRVVGFGVDPNNAARNVGFVYDIADDTAFEVGALDGRNGALAFGISEGGHIVGSSMLNQGAGLPFIWTEGDGMREIPLPDGTSQGSARGVNSAGMAVGTASGAFAVPFLFDGSETFALQNLIPDGTGWDLSMNTSSSAMGISDDGVIVGTGLLDGQIRAFVMTPVPAPGGLGVVLTGIAGLIARRRR